VWRGLLSEAELNRYASEIHQLHETSPEEVLYPEWVLQQLDRKWITQAPTPQEAIIFAPNRRYIDHMIGHLGDPSGKTLEALADYLLSCMPGCHTMRRQRSYSGEYDLVCSVEGFELDFRSELGRYFVCECKDLSGPANFTTMAKFCRVLDSIKSRFGILFSRKGISGEGTRRDAALEQLKVFQDRGIVIVVVDQTDLERVGQGANFISLLRSKYERVRLDLSGDPNVEYRLLSEIAGEIKSDWGERMNEAAAPYVKALSELRSPNESYTGADIILGFLNNARAWRGDTARRIKGELRAILKGESK
jgi:hypothetical protein